MFRWDEQAGGESTKISSLEDISLQSLPAVGSPDRHARLRAQLLKGAVQQSPAGETEQSLRSCYMRDSPTPRCQVCSHNFISTPLRTHALSLWSMSGPMILFSSLRGD
jgi:hypothetical protein